jgi:hypothetical protein
MLESVVANTAAFAIATAASTVATAAAGAGCTKLLQVVRCCNYAALTVPSSSCASAICTYCIAGCF